MEAWRPVRESVRGFQSVDSQRPRTQVALPFHLAWKIEGGRCKSPITLQGRIHSTGCASRGGLSVYFELCCVVNIKDLMMGWGAFRF